MQQQNPNTETLRVYNNEYERYIKNTPAEYPRSYSSMLNWIKDSLQNIPKGGRVLEIGSATGRDSNFIRQMGYHVQASDAAPNFVKYMTDKGEPAILLDILKDKIPKRYNLIFANAVFPHFSDNEIVSALANIKSGLLPQGIVSFNVKQGAGETWIEEKGISGRYTNYQQPDNVRRLVQQSGFEIISFAEGRKGDPPTHIWIRVIARKIS